MGVTHIPATFRHTCDGCGVSLDTSSKDRPKFWCSLILRRDAYDYHGCAVADGTREFLLCDVCADGAAAAVNAALASRRPALAQEGGRSDG